MGNLCGFPITLTGGSQAPCGRCQGCRRQRRRGLVARCLLEQRAHAESCFVTLTYDDEHLPLVLEDDQWIPTLEKSHCQRFLKSVKQRAGRLGVPPPRHFLSGEYGHKNQRPHYHAILFGIGPTWRDELQKLWSYGFISAFPANARTMAYVAKYCLKGGDVPAGAAPLFRLFSQRPAIGEPAIDGYLQSLNGLPLEGLMQRSATTTRIDQDVYPLDRTMREKMKRRLHEGYYVPEWFAHDLFTGGDFGQTTEETERGRAAHTKAIARAERRKNIPARSASKGKDSFRRNTPPQQ